MSAPEQLKKQMLFHEYFSNKIVHGISNIVIWSYYYILLYNQTGSLLVLFQEALFCYIGTWIGYVMGTIVLDRFGYLKSYKTIAVFHILLYLAIIIFINQLAFYYIIFALLRGFTSGLYWPTDHAYSLREMQGSRRGQIINITIGLSQLLHIILPVLVGAFLTYTKAYEGIFIIGIILYTTLLLFPFTYNKKIRSKISSQEITDIIKTPYFKYFFISKFLQGGFMGLFMVFFSIIPYLLIGDELGVGGLASAVAFIGAIVTYFDRNLKFTTKIFLGYIGSFIYMFFTVLLGVFWTSAMVVIRSVGLTFTTSFRDTVQEDIDFRMRELLLGNKKNESTFEMNLLIETALVLGRASILIVCIILFNSSSVFSNETELRILISVLSPYLLALFIFNTWLYKKLVKISQQNRDAQELNQ